MIRFATAALALTGAAFAQAPSPEDQRAFLEKARAVALAYSNLLPDFVCTEVIERSSDEFGSMRFLDTLEVQLTYAQKKEDYKLILGGKVSNLPLESYWGALSFGEFGSTVRGIFEPQSRTEFRWEKAAETKKSRTYVYSYRVPRASSRFTLAHKLETERVAAIGLRGRLEIDAETGMVLHLTADADEIPADFPVLQSKRVIEYAFVDVGGRRYLLPARAETQMSTLSHRRSRANYVNYRNAVQFRAYRKFEVESTVNFGDDIK